MPKRSKRGRRVGTSRPMSDYERYHREHPGDRCNARTRSGGKCIRSVGHGGGHRKSW